VLSNPLRRAAMLLGAFSLLALAGPVASASALVESSKITSPAGPTYALNDESMSSPPAAFTVEGTTMNVAGKIALRCYYGNEPKSYSVVVKELTPKEVTPSEGSFTVEIEPKSLSSGPCVLRAVPIADKEAHAPGTSLEEAGDHFKGPRIVGSRFELYPTNSNHSDYEFEASTLGGYFDLESAGDCGLTYSNLYAPETLAASNSLFFCNAALHESDPATNTRSALQIDGANVYTPGAASNVASALKAAISGAPQVTVEKSFAEGLVTVKELDPIVDRKSVV
jgi:hypothetical protein